MNSKLTTIRCRRTGAKDANDQTPLRCHSQAKASLPFTLTIEDKAIAAGIRETLDARKVDGLEIGYLEVQPATMSDWLKATTGE